MIIPPTSQAALRYFARNIAVPDSRRQRLLHRFIRTRPADLAPNDPLVLLLFCELERAPVHGRKLEQMRAISLADWDQDGRRRLIAFLFDADADSPFAVAKAQTDIRSGSLRPEADALVRAAALLPGDFRNTLPELIRCDTGPTGEVVVLSALPGRSAWFDMRAALLPSRLVDRHFAAAGQWLCRFHEATRQDELVTARHGDFWPHNVLLDDAGHTGVVDWENFSARGSRFSDLFHYPLTYGLAYPWRLYRALPPEGAFTRTFLDSNGVSRAVRQYLQQYSTRTGVPWQTLRTAFRDFLVSRGAMDSATPVLPGVRELPWDRFVRCLDGSRESVFA